MTDTLQVPFSLPFDKLRMYGSMVLTVVSVVRFFARRAKKRTTKEDKVPLRRITCVNPNALLKNAL